MFKKILSIILQCIYCVILFVIGKMFSDTYLCGTVIGVLQLAGIMIILIINEK